MEHPLTRAEAQALIRKIAQLPSGIVLRTHCRERMRKRDIDALDLTRILKSAVLVRDAYQRSGEWRYRLMERSGNAPPRRKNIEVVVVIVSDVSVHAQTTYRKR